MFQLNVEWFFDKRRPLVINKRKLDILLTILTIFQRIMNHFFSLFWNERKRGAAGFTFLQEIIEENDHSLTLIWKIKREKNNGGWYKTPKRNQKMKVGIYSWTNGQWMMTWCDLNLDYANQGVLEGVLNGRLIVTKEHPAP